MVVDITADQFNDEGYCHPKVIVSNESDWHDTFEVSDDLRKGSYFYWEETDPNHFANMDAAYLLVTKDLSW